MALIENVTFDLIWLICSLIIFKRDKKKERKSRSFANGSLKNFHFILNQIHLPKIVNLQIRV